MIPVHRTVSPITKLLVANRGEIALRIMRTAREMDIATVAVFSDPDSGAPFVAAADEAVRLPGANQTRIALRCEGGVAPTISLSQTVPVKYASGPLRLVCSSEVSIFIESPFYRQQLPGAPHPRFPGKHRGFHAPYAPFLKERRTRDLV